MQTSPKLHDALVLLNQRRNTMEEALKARDAFRPNVADLPSEGLTDEQHETLAEMARLHYTAETARKAYQRAERAANRIWKADWKAHRTARLAEQGVL
jgi:hypothetical protein